MTTQAANTRQAGTTADRILDAAEDLFAEKGYSATSLGDVADRVGIRSPSLYNHFRNKEALYQAVLERLLADFSAPLEQLTSEPVTQERVLHWLEDIVRRHHANPNLARLFRPMFEPATELQLADRVVGQLQTAVLQPWAVMAFNNLVMSYVTMAPMYRDLLGQDPFSEAALENQLNLVKTLLKAVFEYKGE